ncbi:hypothetical protein ACLOJK_005226 [Asimina triloba]
MEGWIAADWTHAADQEVKPDAVGDLDTQSLLLRFGISVVGFEIGGCRFLHEFIDAFWDGFGRRKSGRRVAISDFGSKNGAARVGLSRSMVTVAHRSCHSWIRVRSAMVMNGCRLITGPPVDAGDERLPEGDEAGRHGSSEVLLSDEDLLVEDAGCHGSSLGRWWSIIHWCSSGAL